jgi:hypothetical protein
MNAAILRSFGNKGIHGSGIINNPSEYLERNFTEMFTKPTRVEGLDTFQKASTGPIV